jgi:twitching motility protein PilT
MDIAELLVYTIENKASDLHVTVGLPPAVRIHGEVEPMNFPPLSREETSDLIYQIMNDRQKARFEETHDIDFSLDFGEAGRFRVNVFMGHRGVGAVMRVIPSQIKSVEELNLPPVISKMAEYERGLILVTGPTGSGKSTTLAALVDHIAEKRQANIVTIEDPIEYVFEDKNSIVNQREIGSDTKSFAAALRSVMRQTPDVIVIGEMRDVDTMRVALGAAEIGHLVISTLHTVSAVGTVDRMLNAFPPHERDQVRDQFAQTLSCVVSQRLVHRASGVGRVPAVEVMTGSPTIKKQIEEGDTGDLYASMREGTHFGMNTLNQALQSLFQNKTITMDEALAATNNPTELRQMLRSSSRA